MTDSKNKKKKPFDWVSGSRLTDEHYEAVTEVREAGFSKLADGIPADPVVRRQERKSKLNKKPLEKKEDFLLEESESGLKTDFTPSEASKLIHKGKKMQGVQRFKKNPSGKE